MQEILIEVNNVSKRFCKDLKRSLRYGFMDSLRAITGKDATVTELRKDEFWAVKDVSFQLRRGECLGLIGHNGAGKSTLLKMLNGLINPDQGSIIMRGRIGALIELGAGFNPILTGRENIYNNGAVLGFTRKEIEAKIDEIIDFAEIREFIDSPVQNYSSGMRVRLGFAVAAQMEPDILLIDEVLAVGDMGFIFKSLNRISELMPKCSMIFVTHSMPLMARVCTQVMLMNNSKVEYYSNDINTGITRYLEMFNPPDKLIHKTGEIFLSDIKIKNPDSGIFQKHSIILKTDDNLELILVLNFQPNTIRYFIEVSISDGQLREVLSANSMYANKIFSNFEKCVKTYRINLSNLILSTGKYNITISLGNPTNLKYYLRVINAISFTMESVGHSWSTSIVLGDWEEQT